MKCPCLIKLWQHRQQRHLKVNRTGQEAILIIQITAPLSRTTQAVKSRG